MLDRLQEVLDLLNAYEQSILRLEEGLQPLEREIPPAAACVRELIDLLPAHRGFARERALRVQRATLGLHTLFESLRKDAGILHRHVSKLRRDAEIVLLPSLPETAPQAAAEEAPLPAGDYILFRLGKMHFCIFERPESVLRGLSWRDPHSLPSNADPFPGSESIEVFAGHTDILSALVFPEKGGVRHCVWFEEILPSIIKRENRVQLVPAGAGHPLIKSKFRFRGQDYYVVRLETTRQAAASFTA